MGNVNFFWVRLFCCLIRCFFAHWGILEVFCVFIRMVAPSWLRVFDVWFGFGELVAVFNLTSLYTYQGPG